MNMNRLKLLFSFLLLLLALPMWRYLDMLAWFNINKIYSTVGLCLWSSLFLIVPISIIYKKFFTPAIILNLCFAVLVYFFVPTLSSSSLDGPEDRHCSLLNYAGFFYPLRAVMPSAHEDDLLIRNQICWVRKLTQSIPEKLNKHETGVYLKLVEEKLFLPQLKWKTSIPFLLPIYLKFDDALMQTMMGQKFWNNHYTSQIQERDYNFLSYPHSDYIKWEYRLIEKYWSEFLEDLDIEESITVEEK